ncbi:MAG: hypothetical protein ACRDGM_01700 [bacterium]
MRHSNGRIIAACLLSLPILLSSSKVQAIVLEVASNGSDSVSCGSKEVPCRSISQAIANATDRDRIVVGPGLYGDLNNDGDFTDPGEEAAEPGPGCTCMIKVDKSVQIESSDGAMVTVIDVNRTNLGGSSLAAVLIQADGVTFGKKQHGFTVTNSRSFGLILGGSTTNVTVAGNLATRNGSNGNHAFIIQGTGHTVTGNVATGNDHIGFGILGTNFTVTDNVSSANLQGFTLGFTGKFSRNVASGNRFNGIDGGSNVPRLEMTRNTISANRQIGFKGGGTEDNFTFTENNIYGNGTLGGAGNCGVQNDLAPVVPLVIPRNFWGDASGPGPDPADTVCESNTGSVTVVEPIATKPFNIDAKTGL